MEDYTTTSSGEYTTGATDYSANSGYDNQGIEYTASYISPNNTTTISYNSLFNPSSKDGICRRTCITLGECSCK